MTRNPVETAFRAEWPALVATLVRDLRDLALAEDVAMEAFTVATDRWHQDGVPDRPGAWLLTVARRRAIDRVRRSKRFEDRLPLLIEQVRDAEGRQLDPSEPTRDVADDQLAMIFGCCHPALAVEAQVALTLRYIGGLTTAQIARAFMVPEATMAKRLVRAKHKITAAGVPIEIPDADNIDDRTEAVLAVIYAIFTEGHTGSDGATLVRGTLCDEAIHLAETIATLRPQDGEVRALAALCLLTDARRAARVDDEGLPVLLADQDRSIWDKSKIERGIRHFAASHTTSRRGPYQLRAGLAAVHSTAPTYADTEWHAIIGIYNVILESGPNAIVELNRAAAVMEASGPEDGLAAIEQANASGQLDAYHYFHSARAEALRRLDQPLDAAAAYQQAIEHCDNDTERRWLTTQLNSLSL